MISINFANFIPNIGNITFLKIFLKTAFVTVFSPAPLVLTLLLSVGLIYLLASIGYSFNSKKFDRKEKKAFIKKVFNQNKGLITISLLVAFSINFAFNKDTIITNTTSKAAQYDKVCMMIAEKEMEYSYSDQQIKSDMDKSGCNSDSFDSLKALAQIFGLAQHPFRSTPRGTWFQRDMNDT